MSLADDDDGRAQFAEAVRVAIEQSDLGLERIQHHLQERGATVSVATLSYWQSGRSVPGRRSSFTALAQLEDLLGLQPGELASLVPRRSQNPRGVDPVVPLAEVIGTGIDLPEPVAQLDARVRRQLETVSEHATIMIGADRTQRSRWVRHVVRAVDDGADRLLLFNHTEDEAAPPPTYVPLVHCTLGDQHVLDGGSIVVSELCFDRALASGESIIVEYRVEHGEPCPRDTWHELRRQMPLREFVLEVRFDPAALPASCAWYERDLPDESGAGEVVTPVELDATGSASFVRHDLAAGAYGVRWTWH